MARPSAGCRTDPAHPWQRSSAPRMHARAGSRGLRAATAIGLGILGSIGQARGDDATDALYAFWDTVERDAQAFYAPDALTRAGLVFAGGAILANTSWDQAVQDAYQDRLRSDDTDRLASVAKFFGEGEVAFSAALLAAGFSLLEPRSRLGEWGTHASRAYLVGLPPMIVLQRVTGGARPSHGAGAGSRWRPFARPNGVSGHAFVGAVPFLTLSRVYADEPVIRVAAFAASLLPAWSRVNDDAHYLSQAALGWYLAWASVRATFVADGRIGRLTVSPAVVGTDSIGVVAHLAW